MRLRTQRGGLELIWRFVATPDDLADDMLRAIRRIVRRVSEHSQYLSREAGLTVPQLLVLKAIGKEEDAGGATAEVTVVRVSQEVQLSPATVSRIVDRLERAGLVLRERRAKDRRKVCLSLTPAGLERWQTLPKPLQDRFVERLAGLPDAEREGLLASLHRVIELMDAEDLDAAPVLAPGMDVKSGE